MPKKDPVPNRRFWDARLRVNLSRPQVADAANREPALATCTHGALNENTIGRIEQGRIGGGMCPERLAALCAVLGVTDAADIGLVAERRRPTRSAPTQPRKSAVSANRFTITDGGLAAGGTANNDPADRCSVVDPVGFMSSLSQLTPPPSWEAAQRSRPAIALDRPASSYVPFRPATLDAPAQQWLRGDSRPIRARLRGIFRIGFSDVDQAARRLRVLRDLDHGLGAGAVHPQVAEFIDVPVRGLVSGRHDDEAVRREAYRIAVGARELAGYQAVDSGADGVAQRHYLHALSLTMEIGNRTFGAYLLGVSLGHLALHCGYPGHGLRMAQIGLGGLPAEAPEALHAGLWAVVARCYARLGDALSCSTALRTSERHLSRDAPSERPDWISYLTPAYLSDEVAHCMFDLGSHRTAQHEVKQAVAGVGASRVRRLAIDTALFASSLAAAGSVDEACSQGREAVDLAARTTSARAVQRVAQLRADLIPFEDTACVVELIDYIRTTLPAAL